MKIWISPPSDYLENSLGQIGLTDFETWPCDLTNDLTWPGDLDFYIELDQFYANDYNFYTEMEYLLNSSTET